MQGRAQINTFPYLECLSGVQGICEGVTSIWRRFGSALVGAAWIALAAFLASKQASLHDQARVAAAVLVALTPLWEFLTFLLRPFRKLNDDLCADIELELQDQLLTIDSVDAYPRVADLSFHVWVLPSWYRVMMDVKPYRHLVRRIQKRSDDQKGRAYRWADPKLRRVCRTGWQPRQSTGVKFRNGAGLIGCCIRQNLKNTMLTVALDSSKFQAALAGDDEWDVATPGTKMNLDRRSALKLSKIYGQVAGEVLQEEGHAIGCITLDLPPNSDVRLTDSNGKLVHEPVLAYLKIASERVERRLTR